MVIMAVVVDVYHIIPGWALCEGLNCVMIQVVEECVDKAYMLLLEPPESRLSKSPHSLSSVLRESI
jgi:hypothetical protein